MSVVEGCLSQFTVIDMKTSKPFCILPVVSDQDYELQLLRAKQIAESPEIRAMLKEVKDFLIRINWEAMSEDFNDEELPDIQTCGRLDVRKLLNKISKLID
jgi:hypothetical protein